MAKVTLGLLPDDLTVKLTTDADFYTSLRNTAGNYASTCVIALKFDTGDVWTASIAADLAVFNEDKTVVATLLALKPERVTLIYTEGTTDLVWAKGNIDHA